MWVLTEGGTLVNLSFAESVYAGSASVRGFFPNSMDHGYDPRVDLCSCDDEKHGERIIAELSKVIKSGSRWADMGAIKEKTRGGGE